MAGRPDAYMPFYTGDWLRGTARLSPLERDAYLSLIIDYWDSGKPLPDDDAVLARVARIGASEWDAVKAVVKAFFDVEMCEGRRVLRHKRLAFELARTGAAYERRKANADNTNARRQGKRKQSAAPDETLSVAEGAAQSEPEPEPEADILYEGDETDVTTETKLKISYSKKFEAFWTAYGIIPNASKRDAYAAWKATERYRPPEEVLLRCVASYRAFLDAKTRREQRPAFQCYPDTWLTGHRWETFLDQVMAPDSDDGRFAEALNEAMRGWDGKAAAIAREIGEKNFAAWFKGSRFLPGPPAVLYVPTSIQRDRIAQRYAHKLERLLGADIVIEVIPK